MIRILIADDHAIVRKGIQQILSEGFPDAEIDEVANAEAMISKIMESEWDVIISDLSMPGRSGLEAIPQIKQINPKLPVLIMSIHPEDHYAVRVLKAGGSGYLSKDLAPDELVTAVKRVLTGRKYITANVAEKLASMVDKDDDKPLHQMLSDREFTVLQLLGSGKSLSEIAESMILSINTVSTYRSRILVKMNLKNNTDITLYCIENKLM
jgi:two-component system invasion response regulator UvrY